ncbi:MAG: hypothetical protein LQ352_004410 [Teloschistes flavicans]|nr:MAG: hypothetical protein LQ352_004410 [Teloschistes flavicans]
MNIVKTTVASDAAAQHQKKTGKRLTEEKLGIIVQLQDAEIVATHLGPRSSQITLLIKRFNVVGSDSSSQIGSPRHFDSTQEHLLLTAKISEFRGVIHRSAPFQGVGDTLSPTSPARPGLGSFLLTDDQGHDSQQLLSQMPDAYPTKEHAVRTNTKSLHGLRLPQNGGRISEQGARKPALAEMILLSKKSKIEAETKSEDPAKVSTKTGSHVENDQQAKPSAGTEAMDVEQPRQEEIETLPSVNSPKTSPGKTLQRPATTKRIRSRDIRISKEQQALLDRDDAWLPAEPGRRGPVANVPISVLEEITRNVQYRARRTSVVHDREASKQESLRGSFQESEAKGNEDSDSDPDVPVSTADWPLSSPVQEQRRELPPDSSLPDVEELDLDQNTQQRDCATTTSDSHQSETSQRSAPVASMGEHVSGASTSARQIISNRTIMSSATVQVDNSDSDSDLEIRIPLKSSERASSGYSIENTQEVPATAIQASEPSVQFDRRRKADSPVLSPFVSTKRRKVQRSPLAFGFSQDEYPEEDPANPMLRYREEFFASRKSSSAKSRISPSDDADARAPSAPGIDAEAVNSSSVVTPVVERTDELKSPSSAPGVSTVAYTADTTRGNNFRSSPSISNGERSQVSGAADGPFSDWPHRQNFNGATSIDNPLSSSELAQQRRYVASIEQQEQQSLLLTQSVHTDLQSVSTKLGTNSKSGTSQQTHSSGQAQSLPELMTPAMSVSEIAHSSPRLNQSALPQEPLSITDIFARFQLAYPDYCGSRDHFNGMCKKIDQLIRAGRMEHKSLWDDFVIRHRTDYPQYLRRCVDNVEDSKAYEHFYHDEIDEPKFTKRILQPGILSEVIPPHHDNRSPTILALAQPLNAQAGTNNTLSPEIRIRSHSQREVMGEASSREPSIIERDHQEYSLDQRQRPVAGSKALKSHSVPDPSQPIDLASERSSSRFSTPKLHQRTVSPRRSIHRTPRKIPWNESPARAEASPSGNKGQAPGPSKADSSKQIFPVEFSEEPISAGLSSRVAPLAAQRKAGKRAKDHSKTGKGKQLEDQGAEIDAWWKDEDTPFRQFTKKYKSIKPGRGNAWAQEVKNQNRMKRKGKSKEPEVRRDLGRSVDGSGCIDVMKWHL